MPTRIIGTRCNKQSITRQVGLSDPSRDRSIVFELIGRTRRKRTRWLVFVISYTQLHRLLFLNVVNLVNVARRNDVFPRFYAKTLSIYQLSLTLCTRMSSATLQFDVSL